MVRVIVIAMLAIESISDIRTQTVSLIRLIAFALLGITVNYCMVYQSIWSIVGGGIVGIVLLGYALLSRGAMGVGDGVIFLCLGIFLGLSGNLRLLFFSLLIAAIVGGIYALVTKKGIKAKIPFIPCILVGYIVTSVLEVYL